MSDLPHGDLETLVQLILVGSEKDTSNLIGTSGQLSVLAFQRGWSNAHLQYGQQGLDAIRRSNVSWRLYVHGLKRYEHRQKASHAVGLPEGKTIQPKGDLATWEISSRIGIRTATLWLVLSTTTKFVTVVKLPIDPNIYSLKQVPIPAIKEINYNWYRNLFGWVYIRSFVRTIGRKIQEKSWKTFGCDFND